MKEQLASANTQGTNLVQTYATLQAENGILKEQLASANTQGQSLQNSFAALHAENVKLKEQHTTLESSVSSLHESNEDLLQTSNVLLRQIETYRALEAQNVTLTTKLKAADARIETLQEKNAELKAQQLASPAQTKPPPPTFVPKDKLDAALAKIEDLRRQLEVLKQTKLPDTDGGALPPQISALQSQVSALQGQLEAAKLQENTLQTEFQTAYQQVQSRANELQIQNETLQSQLQAFGDEKAKLQAEIANVQTQKSKLETEFRTAYDTLNAKFNESGIRLKEQEKKIAAYLAKEQGLTGKQEQIKMFDSTSKKLKETEDKVRPHEIEILSLKQQLETQLDINRKIYDEAGEGFESYINTLKKELEEAVQKKDEEEQESVKSLQEARAENQRLAVALDVANEQLEQAKQKKGEEEQESVKSLQEAVDANTKLKNANEQLIANIQTLSANYEDLVDKETALQDEIKRLVNLNTELKESNDRRIADQQLWAPSGQRAEDLGALLLKHGFDTDTKASEEPTATPQVESPQEPQDTSEPSSPIAPAFAETSSADEDMSDDVTIDDRSINYIMKLVWSFLLFERTFTNFENLFGELELPVRNKVAYFVDGIEEVLLVLMNAKRSELEALTPPVQVATQLSKQSFHRQAQEVVTPYFKKVLKKVHEFLSDKSEDEFGDTRLFPPADRDLLAERLIASIVISNTWANGPGERKVWRDYVMKKIYTV